MSLSSVMDPDTDSVGSDTLAGSGSGSEKSYGSYGSGSGFGFATLFPKNFLKEKLKKSPQFVVQSV